MAKIRELKGYIGSYECRGSRSRCVSGAYLQRVTAKLGPTALPQQILVPSPVNSTVDSIYRIYGASLYQALWISIWGCPSLDAMHTHVLRASSTSEDRRTLPERRALLISQVKKSDKRIKIQVDSLGVYVGGGGYHRAC